MSVPINTPASVALVLALLGLATTAYGGDPLTVVGLEPSARTLDAHINSPLVVHLDRPVKQKSIVPLRSFWAFGRWSGTVTGTFSFSNGDQTVTLNPDRPLSAGESVMVILSHDIEATDGTFLRDAGYAYQFWTAARPAVLDFVEIDRFSTRTTLAISSRAYGGIASDLNGDEFLDLTIVNEDTADLRVFLNLADGTGAFDDFIQPTFPVANHASPSEPSDFNRDGNVDICVANTTAGSVSILLGNGDGTYAPQQLVSVQSQPRVSPCWTPMETVTPTSWPPTRRPTTRHCYSTTATVCSQRRFLLRAEAPNPGPSPPRT